MRPRRLIIADVVGVIGVLLITLSVEALLATLCGIAWHFLPVIGFILTALIVGMHCILIAKVAGDNW